MLLVPNWAPTYRFISIDPGTETLGVAMWVVDLESKRAMIENVFTLKASRSNTYVPATAMNYGDRYARLNAHYNSLCHIFHFFMPNNVVSESPYMGRFPQAYAALVECMNMLQEAVRSFDYSLRVMAIDPMSAKQSVGVTKRGSNKDLVREQVLALKDISFINNNPYLLDEHSIDAIAVGYHHFKNLVA